MSSKEVNFLDQVEDSLRKLAPDKGLRVWRGRGSGFLYPEESEFEAVVLHFGNGASSKPDPTLSAMAVGFDGRVMRIKADTIVRVVPFGGVHDLQGNVLEVFSQLPSFTDD